MNNEAADAMKLAQSYLEDVEKLMPDPLEIDGSNMAEIRKLLDSAQRQVAKIKAQDPSVKETFTEGDDEATFEYAKTKAFLLFRKACVMAFVKGEKANSAKLLEQAIQLCPFENDTFHAVLASTYAELGKKPEALVHANKAIAIDPEHIGYRKLLDQLEGQSDLKLKMGAFHGSWRFLLAMGAIAVIGLLTLFSGKFGPGLLLMGFGGGVGALYWKQKSK